MNQDEWARVLQDHQEWLLSEGQRGRQAHLENADLQQRDLRGADLRYASLVGAKLQRAQLDGANLAHADLTEADLSYVSGVRLCLDGAICSGTRLEGANLSEARMHHTSFARATLSYATAQRANLTACQMNGCQLRYANFGRADFSDALIERCDFRDAVLTGVTFSGVTVSDNKSDPGAIPTGARLPTLNQAALKALAIDRVEWQRLQRVRRILVASALWLCLPVMLLALLITVLAALCDGLLMLIATTSAPQLNAPYLLFLSVLGFALLMMLLQLMAALLISRLFPKPVESV